MKPLEIATGVAHQIPKDLQKTLKSDPEVLTK